MCSDKITAEGRRTSHTVHDEAEGQMVHMIVTADAGSLAERPKAGGLTDAGSLAEGRRTSHTAVHDEAEGQMVHMIVQ